MIVISLTDSPFPTAPPFHCGCGLPSIKGLPTFYSSRANLISLYMGHEHPFKSLLKVVCLWRPVRPPRSLSPETEVTTGSQFSCILLCTDKWLSICLNSPPHAKGSRVSALKVSCHPAEVCVPLPFRYWRTLSSTQHTHCPW